MWFERKHKKQHENNEILNPHLRSLDFPDEYFKMPHVRLLNGIPYEIIGSLPDRKIFAVDVRVFCELPCEELKEFLAAVASLTGNTDLVPEYQGKSCEELKEPCRAIKSTGEQYG